jgi:hypothetical protein
MPGSGRRKVGNGFVAHDRWRLTLRFSGPPDYRFGGRWRITSVVHDAAGAVASVCRLDRRFAGAFVSGSG